MKRITLLFIFAAIALSCSDDDNDPVSLNGTWKLTYINTNSEPYDYNEDGKASENYLDEINCPNPSTITFGENNTAVFSLYCLSKDPYLPENVNYTTSGNNVTFTHYSMRMGIIQKTTYERTDNKLTATFAYAQGTPPYIPGLGEFGDTSIIDYATFTYTKQ